MNKRFFTVLLAIGFVSIAFGQTAVPMVVKGEMKNVGAMKAGGTVHMRATASAGGSYGLLVNEGNIILNDGLTLASNYTNDAMVFNDSTKSATITFPNAGSLHKNVQVRKTFLTERVTYFSFPFDVALSDIVSTEIDCMGLFNKAWGIAWYDTEERAMNGDILNHWKYFTDLEYATAKLEAGQAYMIGFDTDYAIPAEVTISFPAIGGETVTAIYSSTHETKLKFYYSSTWGIGYAGWNVLGHKNTANFELYQDNMIVYGMDVSNAAIPVDAEVNGPVLGVYIHKSNPVGNPVEGYWETIDMEDIGEDNKLSPYGVYFTQIGKIAAPFLKSGDPDGRMLHYNIGLGKSFQPGLRLDEVKPIDVLRLQLSYNGEVTDKLTVKQGAKYNNAYSLGEDNQKMFNRISPEFYTILEGIPMVINRYRSITQDIPLGLALNQSGQYSIAIDQIDGFENSYVYLVDYTNDKIYNLMDSDYLFDSNVITDNTSYALRITNDPTIISTQGDSNVVIYVSNNTAYIANLKAGDNVSIYDVAGKLISQNKAISHEVAYPLAGPGVYVIKVTGSQTAISKVINQVK